MTARRFFASVLLGIAVLRAPEARAQSEADKAAAEALFQEARKLAAAGNHAEACPKFLLSLKLEAGLGTLLNLADCYEQNGQTASAWSRFSEAIEIAQRAQDKREKYARDRASALQALVPRLNIVVPPDSEVAGLEVLRDGAAVERALWGTAVPIDPGEHVIEARAPGREPWKTTVQLPAKNELVEVKVGALPAGTGASTKPSAGPSGGSSDAASASGTTPGSTQRTLAVAALAVGGVGLVVGTIFGLGASSTWDEAQEKRDNELASDAGTKADLSTVGFAVGGVGLAAGAILWFTAPPSSESPPPASALRLTPVLSSSTVGLSASGRYSW